MKPLRIGLTGGIASGKSTVAQLFASHGVPVIDTDAIARDVVAPHTAGLRRLVEALGPDILDTSGALDRKRLRAWVFADPGARELLESILHPLIREEVEQRSSTAGGLYQVIVIPLLVETNARYIDRVLVVDCSEDTQIQRLLARDTESEAQARAILAAQASRAERLARADDVIANDGAPQALAPQVAALHDKYKSLHTSAHCDAK